MRMQKERITKEDGRWLTFYTFPDLAKEEVSSGPEHLNTRTPEHQNPSSPNTQHPTTNTQER